MPTCACATIPCCSIFYFSSCTLFFCNYCIIALYVSISSLCVCVCMCACVSLFFSFSGIYLHFLWLLTPYLYSSSLSFSLLSMHRDINGQSYPLDAGNMLLRGCVLRNTEHVIGVVRTIHTCMYIQNWIFKIFAHVCVCVRVCASCVINYTTTKHSLIEGCLCRVFQVVYAGHDTKAMLNNTGPRSKRSRLERQMNRHVRVGKSCIRI